MKYKIGEVSRLLNIPVETIRYYEAKGFIHPVKNKDSGYRYYDVWTVNLLLEYKKYRSMEFDQQEIHSIQQSDDIDRLKQRIISKEEDIDKKIFFYQLLKKKLTQMKSIAEDIETHVDRYTLCQSPDVYYMVNRLDFEYDTDKSPLFSKFIDSYPFAENTFTIENGKIDWGFSISNEWVKLLNFDITGAELIRGVPALYTIIKSSPTGCFTRDIYKRIQIYAENNNYIISDKIIGNLIFRTHENGNYVRYLQVWIPVKNNSKNY